MNCVHGSGLWRPRVRFASKQSAGKFKTMPLEQLVVFTPVLRSSALKLHAPSENMWEDRCPYPNALPDATQDMKGAFCKISFS